MDNFTRLWRDFSAAVAGNSTRDDGDSNEYDLGEDGEMVANYFQNSSDACTLTSKKTNASSTVSLQLSCYWLCFYASVRQEVFVHLVQIDSMCQS